MKVFLTILSVSLFGICVFQYIERSKLQDKKMELTRGWHVCLTEMVKEEDYLKQIKKGQEVINKAIDVAESWKETAKSCSTGLDELLKTTNHCGETLEGTTKDLHNCRLLLEESVEQTKFYKELSE